MNADKFGVHKNAVAYNVTKIINLTQHKLISETKNTFLNSFITKRALLSAFIQLYGHSQYFSSKRRIEF